MTLVLGAESGVASSRVLGEPRLACEMGEMEVSGTAQAFKAYVSELASGRRGASDGAAADGTGGGTTSIAASVGVALARTRGGDVRLLLSSTGTSQTTTTTTTSAKPVLLFADVVDLLAAASTLFA